MRNLFYNAEGAAVVIELMPRDEEEGNYASTYEQVIEFFSGLIRKYANNVLIILIEVTRMQGLSEKLVSKVADDIDIVSIGEGEGDAKAAEKYMDYLIKNSSLSGFDADNISFDNEFVKVFFPNINTNTYKIKREEKNRDITIHTPNGIYIIENKIKSIPTNEQLCKYADDSKFISGILTGLQNEKPQNITAEKWNYISYSEISREIKDRLELLTSTNKSVCKMYCDILDNLCSIISEKLQMRFNTWNFDDAEELKEIRFDDAYKKLKLEILKDELLKVIDYNDGALVDNNFTFKVETGFSHKNPLISFKYIYNYEGEITNVYSIGLQIQGNNITRYVETKSGNVNQFSNGYDDFFTVFAPPYNTMNV